MLHKSLDPSKVLIAVVAIAVGALVVTRPALVSVADHEAKAVTTQAARTAAQAPATNVQTHKTGQPKGVDLSHYQSTVDWAKAKADGLAFAYSKASEGNSYVDKSFARHRAGAAKQGVPFGAYHFYRPNDDPKTQAEHFLKTVGDTQGDLLPALDLEIAPNSSESASYKASVLVWLNHVEAATGCKPVVYASPAFWRAHLGADLAGYPFWLAEYSSVPKPPKTAPAWTFWQHSEKGRIAGIKGLVDLDVAASYDALANSICGANKT
ncbi:glycoside hydrolase family 25 protein [Planktotalea sp.]|uniref:glycoside hydrolase family 25 protein n=1 Tax=Planktotalea sp. TaxID=2029877 RepID=UPI003D6A950D